MRRGSSVGDAYRRVAEENIQVHGGQGFTWEADCHLYYKRARSDESWLGDGAHHRERVARLLGGRRGPAALGTPGWSC